MAVSANTSAAQAGDTASGKSSGSILNPSHMTAEEYQKYFSLKRCSTNTVTTKQSEVPTLKIQK